MVKKIALFLALIMLVSCFFVACDKKTNGEDDGKEGQTETNDDKNNDNNTDQPATNINLEDTTDDDDNYFYNPRLSGAYRVSDTTVRVKINLLVYCPTGDLAKYAYAASTIGGSKIRAKSVDILDPKVVGDKDPELYGMTYDVTFESSIPEDGYIFFEETEDSDFDGSLDNVLCDSTGSGLYAAYRPVDKSAPFAAVKYTNDVIEAPEMPTVLLRAYCEDPDQCAIIFEFSKPVAIIDGNPLIPGEWMGHIFVCDQANPTPGKNNSWQQGAATEPIPVGKIESDKNGLIYSSKWECVFSGMSIPEEGVFRISENNQYADSNNPDEEDDDTLGRVVIAIDGTPLMASVPSTWDVAHCKYSSSKDAYISGGTFEIEE